MDDGYNIIVTIGFNLAGDTAQAAHDNPKIWFVGVDQSPICVDETGNADPNFGCKGDAKTLLPNYVSIEYQEDQAGYLAGIVAASVSKSGTIGAIGGTSACAPCVRYIQGYELGAKSVNPDIKVNSAYVVHDFSNTAFNDPTTGVNVRTAVPGPVPRHGRHVPGRGQDRQWRPPGRLRGQDRRHRRRRRPVPVAQCRRRPDLQLHRHLGREAPRGHRLGDRRGHRGRHGHAPATRSTTPPRTPSASPTSTAPRCRADVQAKLDAALAAMKAGTLETCPDNCGSLAK